MKEVKLVLLLQCSNYYGTEHNKKRHELMVAASGINGVAWDGDEFDDR